MSLHNLKCREFRQGVDQVDDTVQVALRTEIQEIRRVREEMNQLLETVLKHEGQKVLSILSYFRLKDRLRKMNQ